MEKIKEFGQEHNLNIFPTDSDSPPIQVGPNCPQFLKKKTIWLHRLSSSVWDTTTEMANSTEEFLRLNKEKVQLFIEKYTISEM